MAEKLVAAPTGKPLIAQTYCATLVSMSLQADLQRIADQHDFSGVVLVDQPDGQSVGLVRGLANRAYRSPVEPDTRFAVASATKGFTALAVTSLIESGRLAFDTPLNEVVGAALSSIDPGVTIEHLLGHTSGVGDYLDESTLGDIDDHVLSGASAHRFERPHHYLPLLNLHPQVSAPGERFAYNNGAYIMLSLVIERVGGRTFQQIVQEQVFDRAGMADSGFLRSDSLPADAAIGYLQNGRSNVFHLPVVGGGDGGAYCTAADFSRLWRALLEGRIVSRETVDRMIAVRTIIPPGERQYGLGFYLAADGRIVLLEGMDAGVSCLSAVHRDSGLICTALSNTSDGVWPLFEHLLPYMQQ